MPRDDLRSATAHELLQEIGFRLREASMLWKSAMAAEERVNIKMFAA